MSGTHDASGSYVGFYAFAGVAGFLVVTATIFIVIHRCRRQYQHERLPVDVVAVEMGAADANTRPARRPRYPEAQPSNHHVEIFARQPPVPGNVILRDRDDLLQLKGCVRRIEVADEDRTERGDVSPALPNSSMMPSFALGNSFFYRTGANSLDETNRTNTNHSPEHSPFYSSVGTNNHPNSSSAARRGLWSSSAMHTQSQERLSGVEVQEDRWRVASSVPINLHHGPLPPHETPPKPPLPPPPATTAASADFIFTVELPPMRCAANNVSSSPSSTGRLLVPLREVHAPGGEVSPSTTPRGLHGLYDGGLLPPLSPPLIPHDAPGGTYPPQRFTSTHTNQTPQHFDASVHHMDDAFSTHGLHLVPPHIQTHHREKNFRSHRHQHHLNHDRGSIKNAKKHNTTRRLRDITKGGYLVYERDLSGDAVVEDAALHEAEEEVELPDGLRPAQSGNTGGASRITKKYYLQKASSFDVYGRGAYLEEPMGAVLPDDAYSPTQHSSSLSSSRPYSPVIVSASSLASSRRAEHSPPNRSRLMDGAGPLCEDARTRGGGGRDDVDVGGTRVVVSPSSPHPVGTPTDSALCSPTSAARGYLFPAPHHD